MQIKDEYDYLIHLIRCALHEETPVPLPETISFEQVLNCGIQHEVAGFAYLGVIRLAEKPQKDILDRWKQRYLLGIQRNSKQENARISLISTLHSNGIATLELQGTKVKTFYPSPDLRMMGDIDIIIKPEEIGKAEMALCELGYHVKNQHDFELDGDLNDMNVEIHTEFFPEENAFYQIMNHPFGYVTSIDDLTATVSDTDFWQYHLLHCLKHFLGSGMGFRRILDLYILEKALSGRVSFEKVDAMLRENGLYEHAADLFALAHYWFDGTETDRDLEPIIAEIKGAGTHGNLTLMIHHKLGDFSSDGKKFPKLRYFLSLACPPKQQVYRSYPFCEKYHLPVVLCWIYRGIQIAFKPGRLKLLKTYIKRIRKEKIE